MPSDWIMPPLIWLSIPRRLSGRPTSCTWTILSARTWPVSVSTSTSAKTAPCTPLACRFAFHSPCAVTPAAGSAAHACFHASDLPPALTCPAAKRTSSGFAPPSSGATFSATARRALTAASLTEGESEAEVVEPPEEFAEPSRESPMRSVTSPIPRPNSSATTARVNVRVPVPKSCEPTATVTEPSRATVTSTLHWLLPPPPHVPTAQPIPRFKGPAPAPGVRLRRSQPISRAPRSSCRW
jgi:hypothetical protein